MKISHILQESPQQCPECGGPAFGDLLLAEKKDACYSKVRSRYKVWPSAYASGALVQCRKKGADNWGNKNESTDDNFGKPAAMMKASPEALKIAQSIMQQQADKNVIGQAKIAGAIPSQGMAEGSNELYQKAIRKYAQQVANDYLGGGNDYLYGANKFDSEMFGVDPKQAQQDFKTLFAQLTKQQGVAEGSNDTIYPNAEVIKSKNGKPVGEIYQDGNSWGAFHYRADRGYDFIDSREDAIEALRDLHQETGRSRPDYTIKGVAEGSETEGTATLAKIAAAGDNGYDMIEDGLNGLLGTEAQIMLQDMYDDVSREHRLHPDDDFEQIYDRMMDRIESDYGQTGMAEGSFDYAKRGKELDASTKKIQANADRRIRGKELDASVKNIQTDLDKRIKKTDKGVAEGSENNPVADAMFARLQQRPDLLRRYGVEYVIQAVHDVADSVGAVDEIGSSDVSGYMRRLELNLKNKLNQYDEPMGDIDRLEETNDEKIAGRHDPEEFDAMVGRLKQLAGAGPLKTVWDEKKRVYRNVPTAQQPNKGSQSNA